MPEYDVLHKMKRKITMAVVGLVLLAIGFSIGLFVQHNRTGYHYEVRDSKDYSSPIGPIRWSYVTESVGMPFLDSGTTILEVDERTIYKAERGFQESSPYARNIIATQDGIAWDDGYYHYNLRMKRMKSGEQDTAGQSATAE